jgi:hypothetical protein
VHRRHEFLEFMGGVRRAVPQHPRGLPPPARACPSSLIGGLALAKKPDLADTTMQIARRMLAWNQSEQRIRPILWGSILDADLERALRAGRSHAAVLTVSRA